MTHLNINVQNNSYQNSSTKNKLAKNKVAQQSFQSSSISPNDNFASSSKPAFKARWWGGKGIFLTHLFKML